MVKILTVAALSLGFATPVLAQSADSTAVASVVERFHRALAEGDSAAALALLADDVVIQESGDVETRDDYRAHHLPADIQFARAVRSERLDARVVVQGNTAWVTARSETRGTWRERPIDSVGVEIMVLSRSSVGWKIRAIHWSSHARRTGR